MGFFDFFRRTKRVDGGPDNSSGLNREDIEPRIRRALDDASGRVEPPLTPDPEVVRLRSRADALEEEITEAMRRENTPASFAGYDVDDDVMLSEVWAGPSSIDLQNDLELLILSRPTAFTGTRFEVSERELEEMREELLEPAPEEARSDDEIGRPSP